MAADCVADGDYLGEYSRFFAEFVARVNPDDQLPVKVSVYDVNENELVGEIISVTLQYLNRIYCPPSLQSYISRLVIQAIKSTCKKQPEICGLRQQEKTYAPLKLMQAVTNEVNEICRRYLDNSRLALLPPPSSTPQVTVGAIRNARRKMEDRHMILHDLNTMFNIQDDTIVDYYAVFDGHGGQDAAAYCATHLHQYLVESVHYPTDPERALRDAFLTTDAQFIAKSSTQKLNGGTTAVCALLINKKLYIAWVGDSMASLVTYGNVKQLVNPHRPTREDESERIRNLGGVVVHCMGIMRVNGFLSISRAIGDVPYKPYISGEPEVRCVPLDGTEDFLIIACDGLWDYVDQRTAALRVYRQVLQNPLRFEEPTRVRSLLDVGAVREAERNIGGDYFLHAHRRIRPVWQRRTSSSKRSVEGHNRPRYLDSPSNRSGPTLTLQSSGETDHSLFFASKKVSIRLVVPRKIGMEIVPRNESLAFHRMRIADCDNVATL
ncbi:PPM1F phosphatase, partial [Acromyrmex insinuator]